MRERERGRESEGAGERASERERGGERERENKADPPPPHSHQGEVGALGFRAKTIMCVRGTTGARGEEGEKITAEQPETKARGGNQNTRRRYLFLGPYTDQLRTRVIER